MDAGVDQLSRLPDELLPRILQFLNTKDGAVTTALSKRWSPMWTSCGAVNLEACILEDDVQHMMEHEAFFAKRDKFVTAAHKALDAFTKSNLPVPVTKLRFRVEGQTAKIVRDFLNREANLFGRPQVIARVLAHPAVSVVEELCIAAVDNIAGEPMLFEKIDFEVQWPSTATSMYSINPESLPSTTLRVLDLTNCGELAAGLKPGISFPYLWKLRLRHCCMPMEGLNRLMESAPLLDYIHLESVMLEDDRIEPLFEGDVPPPPTVRSLHCPAARTLVIYKCCLKVEGTLEVIAPTLQRLEYKGVLRRIVMSPPPHDLQSVGISLIEYRPNQKRDGTAGQRSFWGFLEGLTQAKQLNLMIHLVKGITGTRQGIHLPKLSNIECLELSLVHSTTAEKATMLIADLLSCCPTLRDLRVNLSTAKEIRFKEAEYSRIFMERKYEASGTWQKPASSGEDFQEPVHRNKRLKMQAEVAAGEGHFFDEVSELPGLSGRHLDCLHNCLKRVALQFRQGEKNTFGVKLVKFFAENAKVLEVMCVDAGNARLREHLNWKIESWVAGWSGRRKFKVLPLERRNLA